MSFTIKFASQKEHDEYCLAIAKKLEAKTEKVINASDVLNKKGHKSSKKLENQFQRWTPEEDQFIIDNYGKMNNKQLSKQLNRTKAGITQRCHELRARGHNIPYVYKKYFVKHAKLD